MEKVTTISEYLDFIKKLESTIRDRDGSIERPVLFYRGEEEQFPTVSSSLYLLKRKMGESVLQTETSLLEEAKIRFPEIAQECTDNIDMLIRFQHFGLPTRLLDVSNNPLVALYFACKNHRNHRCGRVLVCTKAVAPYENIRLLGAIIGATGPITLKMLANKICNNPIERRRSLFVLLSSIDQPLLFRAPQTNLRIKAQHGAFIFTPLFKFLINDRNITPSMTDDQIENIEAIENENGNLKELFESNHVIIPAKAKEPIIDELDRIGINESVLFPDEEHKMNYIKDHYVRFKKYDWKIDLNY